VALASLERATQIHKEDMMTAFINIENRFSRTNVFTPSRLYRGFLFRLNKTLVNIDDRAGTSLVPAVFRLDLAGTAGLQPEQVAVPAQTCVNIDKSSAGTTGTKIFYTTHFLYSIESIIYNSVTILK
jgi:hypothetical protein